MPGRHRADGSDAGAAKSPAVKYGAMGLAAVVVIGVGYFVVDRVLLGGCGNVTEHTVAAAPNIAPVIEKIAAASSESELGCARFAVTATDPAAAAMAVADGTAPDLWLPDSRLWLNKAGSMTGAPVQLVNSSVAATPTVVVARAGEVPSFDSWLHVLRIKGLRIGDPLTSSVSDGPVIGALAEAEDAAEAKAAEAVADGSEVNAVSAALVAMAKAHATGGQETDPTTRLDQVAADGGVGIVTEEQLVAYLRNNSSAALTGTVPRSGTFILDYPLAVTAPAGPDQDKARSAGAALAAAFTSGVGRAALSEAGLRGRETGPLDGDRGIGAVRALTVTGQGAVASILEGHTVLAKPSRTLVVEDVSGSMAYRADPDTRVAATVRGTETASRKLPDNAQLGLWAFSVGLGDEQDYRELVPIRRMDESVAGATHRETVMQSVRTLPTLVGGGSSLYDTTIAAFRKVKEDYDPNAINRVIIVTDGVNDNLSSITFARLLDLLQREQDPARPVTIVTIGITEDADSWALQQISAATGGVSYAASDSAEIPNVFVEAMRSRPVQPDDALTGPA